MVQVYLDNEWHNEFRWTQEYSFICPLCHLDQIIFTSVADIICEEDEGNGDDELTSEIVSDEDEILRVCHTLLTM